MLALLLLAPVASQAQPAGSAATCASVSAETCALAKALGRGINLGDMLDTPEEGMNGMRLDPAYFDVVAGKFKTIRLPVRWSNHAAPTADAKLDEFFAERVDRAIDAMLAKGFYVILDLHHYSQLMGEPVAPREAAVEPDVLQARLVNIWRQLGQRYRDRSPRLVFELLNEPHGKLDSAAWNTLLPQVLAAVRESNPTRAVIVGGTYYNSIRDLAKLRLPADRNLIVALHDYSPFPFTHQGVSFVSPDFKVGATCCDAAQQKAITDVFDAALAWSMQNGYPIHVGEFGTYHKADMDSRAFYTRFVRDTMEKRGFNWAIWTFAGSFGVYSIKDKAWIEPLRRALLD